MQNEYFPALASHPLLVDDNAHPETARVLLPSEMRGLNLNLALSSETLDMLSHTEAELRFAQCLDLLDKLRECVCLRAQYTTHKQTQVRGVRGNTRSNALLKQLDRKTKSIANSYRRARDAYYRLKGHGPWQQTLRELQDADIRAMQAPEDEADASQGPREGHRVLSWIWCVTRTLDTASPEMHSCM